VHGPIMTSEIVDLGIFTVFGGLQEDRRTFKMFCKSYLRARADNPAALLTTYHQVDRKFIRKRVTRDIGLSHTTSLILR
jgi:hypothetical protein